MLGPLSYITLVPVMFVTTFNDYKKDLLFFFLLCVNLLGLVFCVFFFLLILLSLGVMCSN